MSRIVIAVVALNLSTFGPIAWAESKLPESIIAITSDRLPFQGVQALSGADVSLQILNLDSVDEIERRLSADLPIDEAQAREFVQRRIAEIGQAKLEGDIRAAYLPLATMMSNGLDRYPVIIFDKQAVVYGVTYIPQAVEHYQQWKIEQQDGERHE